MIEIKKLTISFGDKTVLENVDLKFPRTGLFCVCGESGSGKSSLLNALSGLIPFEGSIEIDGVNISEFSDEDAASYRLKNIGFVFQDFKLFLNQTVEQNIMFPLNILSNCPEKNKLQKAHDLLEICGLEKSNKQICKTLSGGEKQRVAIARALINNPKIIVADEPTGSLDSKNGEEIMELLKSFSNHSLVIVVTHDLELAERFADTIVTIKDKHVASILENTNLIEYSSNVLSVKEQQKKKPSVPFSFALNHARQTMKTKRIRSIISTIFMSIGLVGIGLSISFSNSISNDLKRSYSSLVETATISVNKSFDSSQKLSNISYDEAVAMGNEVKNEIPLQCGVGYKANFEEFFKDCNAFYIESKNNVCFLDELSARDINDFLALDEVFEDIYPYNIDTLEDDEIVLGLTINQIREICATFGIERSVNSLSNYLKENFVKTVIEISNIDWEYFDQQIFTVKGFTLSSDPYIAHSNLLFNKIVFEDNMRFPTTETYEINEFPWVLEKITYIKCNNPYEFICKMRERGKLDTYVFEISDKNLFVNKLLDKNPEDINYLIPYFSPKDKLSDKEIEFIMSVDPLLKNPIKYNNGGYVNFPMNLISGFANRTYFSLSEEDLFLTIENNASIEFNQNEQEVLVSSVLFSDFTKTFDNPIYFISDFKNLKKGREPLDLDEIVVSTGLLNALKNNKVTDEFLYVATATKEINKNAGIFNRVYETAKLKIVGVVENEKYAIYHNQDWTEDFFLLKNGQKISGLIPHCVSFAVTDDTKVDGIIAKLKRAFPQYEIINPLLDINESVDSLCSAISIFILGISMVSLVISLILLCSCTYLYVQDIKIEIALARCIGINKTESLKFLYGYTVFSSGLSLVVSLFELTMVSVFISYVSSSILTLPFEFSITPSAYIVMMVGCCIVGLCSCLIAYKHIKKISPMDCLKI